LTRGSPPGRSSSARRRECYRRGPRFRTFFGQSKQQTISPAARTGLAQVRFFLRATEPDPADRRPKRMTAAPGPSRPKANFRNSATSGVVKVKGRATTGGRPPFAAARVSASVRGRPALYVTNDLLRPPTEVHDRRINSAIRAGSGYPGRMGRKMNPQGAHRIGYVNCRKRSLRGRDGSIPAHGKGTDCRYPSEPNVRQRTLDAKVIITAKSAIGSTEGGIGMGRRGGGEAVWYSRSQVAGDGAHRSLG